MIANAAMAAAETSVAPSDTVSEHYWCEVDALAPQLATTARRYLAQTAVSLKPHTILGIDATLRYFTAYLLEWHPETRCFADVTRIEVEGFKIHLAKQISNRGTPLTANTMRFRLGKLRSFFDRIVEWGWYDAPRRSPMCNSDLPLADDLLPKFLDDGQAAHFMRAAAQQPPLRRLVVELLARTGVRVGELCALRSDAVTRIGEGWWLHIELGKLHNDRYIPLHPQLVKLLAEWKADHLTNDTGRLLVNKAGNPLNQQSVARIVKRVANQAGIGHVHPHQLRHTLATQAVNRGMRLEAIAAMLGHRSLHMTLVYARIANRTVADEYHAVSKSVDDLYKMPDDITPVEGPNMRRLRADHHRMLGNGFCNRPAELDCAFETICEGCGFFETTVEFLPTLKRQRDHATDHDQPARAELFNKLVTQTEHSA